MSLIQTVQKTLSVYNNPRRAQTNDDYGSEVLTNSKMYRKKLSVKIVTT